MMMCWVMMLLLAATNGVKSDPELEVVDEAHDIENEGNKTMSRKSSTVIRTDTECMTQKTTIISCLLLLICCIGGVIGTYVNVNDDFSQLNTFYAGYMGRKLISREILGEDKDRTVQQNGSANVMKYCGKYHSTTVSQYNSITVPQYHSTTLYLLV